MDNLQNNNENEVNTDLIYESDADKISLNIEFSKQQIVLFTKVILGVFLALILMMMFVSIKDNQKRISKLESTVVYQSELRWSDCSDCDEEEIEEDIKSSPSNYQIPKLDIIDDNKNLPEIHLDKPAIYFHGYNNENVKVKLNMNNEFGKIKYTYPQIDNNEWNVYIDNDGIISDVNGKYNYLFWEADCYKDDFDFTKGYCIKGNETEEFLKNTLKDYGLSDTEISDFITYWVPKMINNKYNVITFLTDEYIDNVELEVTPKPDKVIRVAMVYYPSDIEVNIKSPIFIKPVFYNDNEKVVTEWGGCEISNKLYFSLY